MPETDLILLFTRPLQQAALDYFITGSMAGMIYGEPRLTMDVDLVLVLPHAGIKAFVRAFDEANFYSPPAEVITQEVTRPLRGHFNLIHHETGFKADIYLAGNDPLHAWAMERRREIKLGEDSVWVAPPEYVILRKLEYYHEGRSEKHLRDIHAMIERSGDEIDESALMRMIDDQGLTEVWKSFSAWRSW
jgi:hypothetical protein